MKHSLVSSIGRLLRAWRRARSMTQMDLAFAARISARHLSFVETGRAQPSLETVMRLGNALELPLREQNALLEASGFAPRFPERTFDAPELERIRRFFEHTLKSAEPSPAVVMDRMFNVMQSNRGMDRLVEIFAGEPSALRSPLNLLHLVLRREGLREAIVNADEVAQVLVRRVQREALLRVDDRAQRFVTDLMKDATIPENLRAPTPIAEGTLLLPIHLKRGSCELRLFSAITTLGSPRDVTLQELQLENFVPADRSSEEALEAIAGQSRDSAVRKVRWRSGEARAFPAKETAR